MTSAEQENGLLLTGLDGTNPLGFLAALGTLRIVTHAFPNDRVRLLWEAASGTWVPKIFAPAITPDALLDLLDQHLLKQFDQHPVKRVLTLNNGELVSCRRKLIEAAANSNRIIADWVSAIACDIVPSKENNQLQTSRRDYFKGNLKSVIERTEKNHIDRSIFHIWDYADAIHNQSLHFDPSEDRRHAHQWNKPSGDPDRQKSGGMLGANRLALEAIPIFLSLPEQGQLHTEEWQLHTIGFHGFRSDNTRWTWPLWKCAIDLETTRTLLTLTALQQDRLSENDRKKLNAMGVVSVMRLARILVEKTPNFTPPERIA